ncbi:hypothetical protein ABIB40_002939 [Pedobacter sp. UYP30]|uniref:hypothetical protein n=1 Tax=Pedobacter sp. UYP30 TaxID=1756400 RepID=UPI003394AEC3
MLSSISWLQYFSALAILVTGYYSIVILTYYRLEIVSLINHKKPNSDCSDSEPIQKNILGETKDNPNESTLAADELRFSSEDADVFNDDNF